MCRTGFLLPWGSGFLIAYFLTVCLEVSRERREEGNVYQCLVITWALYQKFGLLFQTWKIKCEEKMMSAL